VEEALNVVDDHSRKAGRQCLTKDHDHRRNHDPHHEIGEGVSRDHRLGGHHRIGQRSQEDNTPGEAIKVDNPSKEGLREGRLLGKLHKDLVLDVLEGLSNVQEEAGRRTASGSAPFHECSKSPNTVLNGSVLNSPVGEAWLASLPGDTIGTAEPSAGDPNDRGVNPDGAVTTVRLRDQVHQKVEEVPGCTGKAYECLNDSAQDIEQPIIEVAKKPRRPVVHSDRGGPAI
jgi:hypothetical protein